MDTYKPHSLPHTGSVYSYNQPCDVLFTYTGEHFLIVYCVYRRCAVAMEDVLGTHWTPLFVMCAGVCSRHGRAIQ